MNSSAMNLSRYVKAAVVKAILYVSFEKLVLLLNLRICSYFVCCGTTRDISRHL